MIGVFGCSKGSFTFYGFKLTKYKDSKCVFLMWHATVFSSSATVYGSAKSPVTEETEIGKGTTSPYADSKCVIGTACNVELL